MPFPVRGQITHRFGRQPHPVFKNIQEENSGIKISVPAGSVAKSVFRVL
jgi:septal ring factor EnvC (AmiA/AmiB activator)